MKKSLRILIALSITASSIISIQPASAVSIGALYNGTSGDVACTTGFFEILNNVVINSFGSGDCKGSAVIPNGVTSINNMAFFLLELTSISIPNSVTSIGDYAFFFARGLTSFTIPNSVTSLGEVAFGNLPLLSSYQYCETILTDSALSFAGLGSKTKTCPPSVTAPGSPISVVATATGKRNATVSFAAPASNGGSAVFSYTATSSPGGLTQTVSEPKRSFNFDYLQPGTEYVFAVTAKNAIGTSAAATSNSVSTAALVVASLSALSFEDDGDGKSGKIVWAGMNIDSVLYKGPELFYPGPFKFGAFTSGWNGRIRNLIPNTNYEISIVAFSADGVGGEKSLTFTTNSTPSGTQTVFDYTTGKSITTSLPVLTEDEKLAQLLKWVNENTYVTGEASNMSGRLTSFAALETSPHSSTIRVPLSSVSNVVATSLTPLTCSVNSATAAVEPGLVTALSGEKCTISYTVSGGSNAPATLVRDFYFKTYVSLPVTFACGDGFYTITAGVVTAGSSCTGAVTIDASATSIEDWAFYGSKITSITIPNSVTAIGYSAFYSVESLKNIVIGNSLTTIGSSAFSNTSFSSILLPNSLRTLGTALFFNSALTSLIIPVGTTNPVGAFAIGAGKLTTVTIPNTVTEMAEYSFFWSEVKIVNYCGNNASVLAAIAKQGISPTCVAPVTAPMTTSNSNP
jgi:trimeric autotransporter adhesin